MCCGSLIKQEKCICQSCIKELPWITTQCQRCSVPLTADALCANCQLELPTYRRCIAVFSYQAPIDTIILHLKNDPYAAEIKQLTEHLVERIILSYHQTHTPYPQLVIPMPLHWKKMTQRGFNQSHIISRLLADHFLLEHKTAISIRTDLCQRVTHNPAQHTLDKIQRSKSIKNAFAVTAQAATTLKGLSIAVVDDVVTTGATANAISGALLNAGANQVDIWCLARTSWNTSSQ